MTSSTATTKMPRARDFPVFSRRQIEGMIAEGRHIIIVDQHVLKVDAWVQFHPGGDKAIKHMVGRDATDEVTVLHSADAKQRMKRYRIAKIEGRWKNFVPPIQGGKFRPLVEGGEHEEDEIQHEIRASADATWPSSDASSREASPVFDVQDSTLRRRDGPGSSTSSISSASTPPEDDQEKEMTPTGFLDTQTRKKISLDIDKYPSLDNQTQGEIVRKYRLLSERIEAEGLYQCNYLAYAVEFSRYCALFLAMLFFLRLGWYATSAACLGMCWHQLVFLAHDAGHMGITHDFHVDSCIGIFVADFIGGLSLCWWKRSHNVHHIVTNHPEHDPDIEHMPFLAISHRLLSSLYSTYYDRLMKYDAVAKIMIRIQPYTYYFLMLLGRFNLYLNSWDHILAGRGPRKGAAAYHRWLEIIGQVFFWTWFGYGILYCTIPTAWQRFVFVMVSHMMQSPLHVQITLSHFAMSTADVGPAESFPQKMLRTTMDVDSPQWLDFFHGGLQFQVVHHLYPRIPRHNLRRTQKLVQKFCDETAIPYALYGFVDCNKEVIGRLDEVSRQAAIFAECQKVAAQHT